jgi:tellurite resistance protein
MFLAELQPDEKKAFLELASLITKIDGKQSIYEKSLLEKYRKEMELQNYSIKGLDIEDILQVFKDERVKHIVLAEILRMVFSDGVFNEQERESIRLIKRHFGLNAEYESFKDWVAKIKELSINQEN